MGITHNRKTSVSLAAENRSPKVEISQWFQTEPDALNWSKLFPYQLLVLKKNDDGGYVADDRWSFTLPLGLQELVIGIPFAHSLNLNQNGATEQRGGQRIRPIRASGTTGVLPLRPTTELGGSNSAQSIFAGTIARTNATLEAGRRTAEDVTPGSTVLTRVLTDKDIAPGSDIAKTSGYFQFRLLQQFLERYAEIARKKEGKDLRLALACWKDEAVYIISPQSLDFRRNAVRPRHYDFTFSAQAFARVSVDRSVGATESLPPIAKTPSVAARALQTMRDARKTILGAKSVIGAVSADLTQAITEPLRETTLLICDFSAANAALTEFPANIIQGTKQAMLEALGVRNATENITKRVLDKVGATSNAVDDIRRLAVLISKSDVRSAELATKSGIADIANEIFEDPDNHYDLFSSVNPGELRLPNNVLTSMEKERSRIRNFTRADLEIRRSQLQESANIYADYVGLSSELTDKALGRKGQPAAREHNDQDIEILYSLNNAVQVLDALVSRTVNNQSNIENSQNYVSSLAKAAGWPFGEMRSKFVIPFPYGTTLETIAQQYLQDPNRWIEIANLNGLRSPYIDEVGKTTPLIAQPSGREILLGSEGSELRIGQVVTLTARSTPTLKTVIVNTQKVGSSYLIELSDSATRFHLNDGASINWYLPDTINSRMLLWIPSDQAPSEEFEDETVNPLELLNLNRVTGADLLLDSNNNLVIGPEGDFRLVRGLALVVQAVRLALATPRGSLIMHPSYGLPQAVGETLYDVDAKTLANSIKLTFAEDPLFRSVDSISVDQKGGKVKVGLSVGVKGVDRLLPIGLEIVQ